MKNILSGGIYTGERALFSSKDLTVNYGIFKDGESPLKESSDIETNHCIFEWKYPLWYCNNVSVNDCQFIKTSRAGIWYSKNVSFSNCEIQSPKNFRRCTGINLNGVTFSDAAETMWNCEDVVLDRVTVNGQYFCMGSRNVTVNNSRINGDYAFDGVSNLVIKNSVLVTKDAFWNCKNALVENCTVIGEYFGWNSENITLKNCTVQSLQGFCYIKNLKMENCKLIDTSLAFEYSTVDADISSEIESVLNPESGKISAFKIKELIIEPDRINPDLTEINAEIEKTSDNAAEVFNRNV